VAWACNPSYSGGRDQEDGNWKIARANSSVRTYLENSQHKTGLVECLPGKCAALNSNPSTIKRGNKKRKIGKT
jgi:hypothetical protein